MAREIFATLKPLTYLSTSAKIGRESHVVYALFAPPPTLQTRSPSTRAKEKNKQIYYVKEKRRSLPIEAIMSKYLQNYTKLFTLCSTSLTVGYRNDAST